MNLNKILLDSAKAGDLDKVKAALMLGADVNAKDEDSLTPLHSASWNGHLEVVKILLVHGAEVNAMNKWGRTALHEA